MGDVLQAGDTDGFRATRLRAGGLFAYDNPWRFGGIAVQTTRYAQANFEQRSNGIVGFWRDQNRATLAGVDAEVGVVDVSGRARPIGDATWRIVPDPTSAVELSAAAGLVETPQAIAQAIGFSFWSVTGEKQFGERFTAVALAGWQPFSDGNNRFHLRARLIWLLVPEQGITVQLRYRQYENSDEDVGGAYFNPQLYQQWLAVGAIRKRLPGWVLSGALGAGQERSTGNGSQASYLAEARAEGNLTTDLRLVLRAGYYRSAGFASAPDYAYSFVGATLIAPF